LLPLTVEYADLIAVREKEGADEASA
jgi:hypothetical protein